MFDLGNRYTYTIFIDSFHIYSKWEGHKLISLSTKYFRSTTLLCVFFDIVYDVITHFHCFHLFNILANLLKRTEQVRELKER